VPHIFSHQNKPQEIWRPKFRLHGPTVRNQVLEAGKATSRGRSVKRGGGGGKRRGTGCAEAGQEHDVTLQSLLIAPIYRQYSAIADLHTFHFTDGHTLGFSVFISLLATDLNTETITVSQDYTLQISVHYSTHKAFKSHVKSSHADLLHSSVLLIPIRSQLIFTIHAPFSSLYSQLLNPPGLSTLSVT
jgi:hypothetical protein